MAKKARQERQTLLIVGEGGCEQAFLKHLRDLYCSDGAGVALTVFNAKGGCPENIIREAVKQARNFAYDARVVLLDNDVFPADKDKLKKIARKDTIWIVESTPCLEGMLLAVLEEQVPEQSRECKEAIRRLLGQDVDMTEWKSYESRFSKKILEDAKIRPELSELDRLLRFLKGELPPRRLRRR